MFGRSWSNIASARSPECSLLIGRGTVTSLTKLGSDQWRSECCGEKGGSKQSGCSLRAGGCGAIIRAGMLRSVVRERAREKGNKNSEKRGRETFVLLVHSRKRGNKRQCASCRGAATVKISAPLPTHARTVPAILVCTRPPRILFCIFCRCCIAFFSRCVCRAPLM